MGHISFFDLNALKKTFKADVFIETGTYLGDSLAHAARADFKKLYSIEIAPDLVAKARERFKHDPRIEIIEGSSSEVLEPLLNRTKENIVLWLDAHFSGCYADYNGDQNKDSRVPLEAEILALQRRSSKYADVILIDDLRCYEDSIPGVTSFNDHMRNIGQPHVTREQVIGTDSKFIYDAFSATHDIVKHPVHEGYLSLTPNQNFIDSFDKVVFFNHGHLGDTLIAKIFIRELVKQFPTKKTAIANNYNIHYIKDIVEEHININSIPIGQGSVDRSTEFMLTDRVLYINTWFAPPCVQPSDADQGAEFTRDIRDKDGVVYNYDLHLKCFQQIIHNINYTHNGNLDLSHMWKNKNEYLLEMYNEDFDVSIIPFINDLNYKKILIFNQTATSGQSDNANFSPFIDALKNNEHVVVYTSQPSVITHPRVINLRDYYGEPDLFKTAKVSMNCDIICGPSNATIISTWVKPNLMNNRMHYIVINRNNAGEATLFKDLACKTTVVSTTHALFDKIKEII